MDNLITAARAALEALEESRPLATEDDYTLRVRQHWGAVTALRTAIAAAEAQPAVWVCPKCGIDRGKAACPHGHSAALTGQCPMVGTAAAAPPQVPQPLTEFKRMQIIGDEFPLALVEPIIIQKIDSVVLAVERAHGIKP